jgi:hypothetical protein
MERYYVDVKWSDARVEYRLKAIPEQRRVSLQPEV